MQKLPAKKIIKHIYSNGNTEMKNKMSSVWSLTAAARIQRELNQNIHVGISSIKQVALINKTVSGYQKCTFEEVNRC